MWGEARGGDAHALRLARMQPSLGGASRPHQHKVVAQALVLGKRHRLGRGGHGSGWAGSRGAARGTGPATGHGPEAGQALGGGQAPAAGADLGA